MSDISNTTAELLDHRREKSKGTHDGLCQPPDDELFQERAAIRQYDGGLSRADAEILARHDLADATLHEDRR